MLAEIEALGSDLGLRVHFAILGEGRPDLTSSTEQFLRSTGHPVPTWPAEGAAPDLGTAAEQGSARDQGRRAARPLLRRHLADEAMIVAGSSLGAIRSNIAHDEDLLSAGTCALRDTSSSTSATTG